MKKIKDVVLSIVPFAAGYALYEIAPDAFKSIIYAAVLIGLGVFLILVKRLLSDLRMHYMEIAVLRTLLDTFHATRVTEFKATEWGKSDTKEGKVTIVNMETGEEEEIIIKEEDENV